jgi:hypothetical protein
MNQTAPTEIDLIALSLAAKVDLFIDFVFGGQHHTKKVIDHDGFFEVKFWQDVATWDGDLMTKMVVASHDLGLRTSVENPAKRTGARYEPGLSPHRPLAKWR